MARAGLPGSLFTDKAQDRRRKDEGSGTDEDSGTGEDSGAVARLRWTARRERLLLSKALLVERRTARLEYAEELSALIFTKIPRP